MIRTAHEGSKFPYTQKLQNKIIWYDFIVTMSLFVVLKIFSPSYTCTQELQHSILLALSKDTLEVFRFFNNEFREAY